MERKLVLFPESPKSGKDPVAQREAFFQELELKELTKSIPQAVPQTAIAQ